MIPIAKGDFVWLDPAQCGGYSSRQPGTTPIGCRVLALGTDPRGEERIALLDDEGNKRELGAVELQRGWALRPMHPTSIQGVEDLQALAELHEAAVLRNLLIRHREGIPFTFVGTRILLAMAPQQMADTAPVRQMYAHKSRQELPPHILSIGAELLRNNIRQSENSGRNSACVVFAGESGSGKSECANQLIRFLAANAASPSLEAKLHAALLLIEAFTNAHTPRSRSASRMGRLVEVVHTAARQKGAICSARVEHFLLEKSRTVEAASGAQSNFHVFYSLLAGLGAQKRLSLELTADQPQSYHLLGRDNSPTGARPEVLLPLADICAAMRTLLLGEAEIDSIWTLLSALLHLGNLRYSVVAGEGPERVEVSDRRNLTRICRLLKLEEQSMLEALITRTVIVRGELCRLDLEVEAALDARDWIIKECYSRLVEHILGRVNEALGQAKPRQQHYDSILLVDFPGFEFTADHSVNNFEQLCSNYAAECLQQFFARRVFKLEQAEYAAQGLLGWACGGECVPFADNAPVLDTLAVQPLSVMSVVDDASCAPQATDEEALDKLYSAQQRNERYFVRPKSRLCAEFAVRHYTGVVHYKAKGMLHRNRDQLPAQLRNLLAASDSKFFRRLFERGQQPTEGTISRLKQQTVGTRIRRAMDSLMGRLEQCAHSYFVRCLKPNDGRGEMRFFDRDVVLRQLRHLDVLSAAEQCRAGFPLGWDYAHFVAHYRALLPEIPPPHKCHCVQAAQFICRSIFGSAQLAECGKTKIFLRSEGHSLLEGLRADRLHRCALLVQKCVRGWAQRQQFERIRWAAVVFQKNWRALVQRREYQKVVRGITRLQALVRARQRLVRFQWLREGVVRLQAHCRAAVLRHQLRCLPTREERRGAMALRMEAQRTREGPPPAMEQHSLELDSDPPTEHVNGGGGIQMCATGQVQPATANRRAAEELSVFRWEKFALAHFQGSTPASHCRTAIKRSLLPHRSQADQRAALAIWRKLQELMGDRESEEGGRQRPGEGGQMMDRVRAMFQQLNEDKAANCLVDCGDSALRRVQFIVGVGILRPQLRDEIYSQLCKQISGNPWVRSALRAWMLLSLCADSFCPSPRLFPFLLNFVRHRSPTPLVALRVECSLARTRKSGPRREPPLQAELAAACSQCGQKLVVNVRLPDGRSIPVQIESQSSTAEVCCRLAAQIGLGDALGFGLFLVAGNSVRALGAGAERVMDALAVVDGEQQWRLLLRKELFHPHELAAAASPAGLELAFRQVANGFHSGEYSLEKEEDIALLAAQQHFVDIGGAGEVCISALEEALDGYLPKGMFAAALDQTELDTVRHKWVHLVMHAFRKRVVRECTPSADQVRAQVCAMAQQQWPLLFSRFFELSKFSGPPLPTNHISLGVNSAGLTLFDQRQNALREIAFVHLAGVGHARSKQQGAESVSLHLLNGDRFTFQSPRARELAQLLARMLLDLRLKSKYAIALKEAEEGGAKDLAYSRGDLLILSEPWEVAAQRGGEIESARTGLHGRVPAGCIHVLASVDKPSVDELESLLTPSARQSEEGSSSAEGPVPLPLYEYPSFGPFAPPMPLAFPLPMFPARPPHTLEQFAADNFRQPHGDSRSSECGSVFGDQQPLWRHSREPLKAPLLKRLAVGKEEAVRESLASFDCILKYMGDQPSPPLQYFLEHTDSIFAAPLKYEILRDETYCQLMRQLTENPNPLSEERGWELMWLCLGLFPPSKGLQPELSQFLRTRLLPLAADCALRLERASSCSPALCRSFAPHHVELEAIQHRQTHIYHKIHLPDGSKETVEVESWTRAKNLQERIASRLGLRSAFGFCLFVKVGEKVVSIPVDEFFFDFVHQLQDWARKSGRMRNGGLAAPFAYQVHFMRKLWLDVVPGADPRQDLLFHYHQELPKYLRGYYLVGKKEAPQLAALVLRAQTRDDKEPPLAHLQHILHQLVPRDLLKAYGPNEWKKLISAEFERRDAPSCAAEAKLTFLRQIAKEPTFGGVNLAEKVKQSADPTMCSKLLVAISCEGMSLYNLETKRYIGTYGFGQISQWQAANTYFHVTLEKGNRLLVETTLGHKMDDLLTSYIQAMISRREGNGGTAGGGGCRESA